MNHSDFVRYVKLLEPCIYHSDNQENMYQVLAWFDCPKEWREPVRVVADGWSYYGADVWYAKYIDPSLRKDYMDKYWDEV